MLIRTGTCKQCGKTFSVRSNHKLIAEYKADRWLYLHYLKEHKTNIIIKFILRQE